MMQCALGGQLTQGVEAYAINQLLRVKVASVHLSIMALIELAGVYMASCVPVCCVMYVCS